MNNYISFMTPVIYQKEATTLQKIQEKVDDYLYLGRMSAYVIQGKVDNGSQLVELKYDNSPKLKHVVFCALKIATYMTIVMPLIAFALKAILRSGNHFHIGKDLFSPLPQELPLLIFKDYLDGQDLARCNQVCKQFHKMIQQKPIKEKLISYFLIPSKTNPLKLISAPMSLRNDLDFMKEAFAINSAMATLGPNLMNQMESALELIEPPYRQRDLGPDLKKNQDFFIKALEKKHRHFFLLEQMDTSLKNNPDFILNLIKTAVRTKNIHLAELVKNYASSEIRNSSEITLKLITYNFFLMSLVGDNLKNDPSFWVKVLTHDSNIYVFEGFPRDLLSNKGFILDLLAADRYSNTTDPIALPDDLEKVPLLDTIKFPYKWHKDMDFVYKAIQRNIFVLRLLIEIDSSLIDKIQNDSLLRDQVKRKFGGSTVLDQLLDHLKD